MKCGTRLIALAFLVAINSVASGATMTAYIIDVGQEAARFNSCDLQHGTPSKHLEFKSSPAHI